MPSVDLMTYKQKIELDDSGFNSGMSKAESSFGKFTSGLGTVGGALAKTIGAGVLAAGGALVAFGKQGIETASNLNEVQNVIDSTFGVNASQINTWAKSAATSFGLSELSAKQFTGTMGAMLKSMGLGGTQVTDMSTKIAGLAGDFASFYNLNPEEAFAKIRAGISGETEPLKALGLNMSVANLNAYAMSQGLNKTYDSMTQAEQATLRYNYLLSASADAQGDFSKTSNSFANQMRILQLNVTDLAASFGQALLPMANQGLSGILDFVNQSQGAFSNLFSGFAGLLSGAQGAEEQFTSGASTIIDKIVQSVTTLAPKILTVITNLIPAVGQAILTNLPVLIKAVMDIFPQVTNTILSMLPMILECGIQMILAIVQGLAQALPQLIPQIVNTVLTMVDTLIANIDALVDAGLQLLMGLAEGLIQALPQLIEKAPVIIQNLIDAIVRNLPKIIEVGIQLIISLAGALIQSIPLLLKAIPQIISSIVNGFSEFYHSIEEIGLNLIKGIWNGISNAASWLWDKVSGFCGDLVDNIKNGLGIHSPSTIMRDLIGKNLALGVGEGFMDSMVTVSKQMQQAIPTDFDFDVEANINRKFSNLKFTAQNQMQTTTSKISTLPPVSLVIHQGNITVQGSADDNTLKKVKKLLDDQVSNVAQQVEKQIYSSFNRHFVLGH